MRMNSQTPSTARRVASRAVSHRTAASRSVRIGALVTIAVLLPNTAGATPTAPTQSVESLQAKAEKVANELAALDTKTNELDEQFNNARIELEGLQAKLAANQGDVDEAEQALEVTHKEMQQLALDAYVGTNQAEPILGISDNVVEDSRRSTFLETQFGESSEVVDGLQASRKDLADSKAVLDAAAASIDKKVAEIESAQKAIEATISERQELQDSVKGELADALAIEQARLAEARAAKAEADARAAAVRASAARRPVSVVVPASNSASSNSASSNSASSNAAAAAPAPAPAAPAAPTSTGVKAVDVALAQMGKPYLWAASGPNSFDCSGLVQYSYAAAGVSLPHSSRSLRSMTQRISESELRVGDLVFGGNPVHHVGIYIGNGQMVHAPSSGDVVKISGIYRVTSAVSFGRL